LKKRKLSKRSPHPPKKFKIKRRPHPPKKYQRDPVLQKNNQKEAPSSKKKQKNIKRRPHPPKKPKNKKGGPVLKTPPL